MIKQPAKYICDVCGKEIDTGLYSMDIMITIKYNEFHANGWNEWEELKENHIHKSCLKDFMI